MKKADVRMEDINEWVGELIDKISLTVEDVDVIDKDSFDREYHTLDFLFDVVREKLECFFNYPDYRKFN